MAALKVTRQELVEAGLDWLLDNSRPTANYLTEIYLWDLTEHAATICLLAGIGEILGNKDVDIKT